MDYKKQIPADIIVVIFFTLLTSIFELVPPLDNTIFRKILGLPAVLFFPGYSLIAALFPGKDDLSELERFSLSFGLSIAAVPLLGLGLNYTHWGIRQIPVLLTLDIFTLGMCAMAIFRRSIRPQNEVFIISFSSWYQTFREELFCTNRPRIDKILTVILVTSIMVSVSMLVYVTLAPKVSEKFTEFYILGPGGMTADYPVRLNLSENGTVIVGIVNKEHAAANYSLDILLDDVPIEFDHKDQVIMLVHNQTWEYPLTFNPGKAGTDMKVQFNLYKEDYYKGPYRELQLWINVTDE